MLTISDFCKTIPNFLMNLIFCHFFPLLPILWRLFWFISNVIRCYLQLLTCNLYYSSYYILHYCCTRCPLSTSFVLGCGALHRYIVCIYYVGLQLCSMYVCRWYLLQPFVYKQTREHFLALLAAKAMTCILCI